MLKEKGHIFWKGMKQISNFCILSVEMFYNIDFGPQVYPLGSIVIALVRLSVSLSVCLSVLKFLRDRSLVFSETLHEFRGQLSKKKDTAEILKKF